MHKNKGLYGKRDDQALQTTNLLWGHSGGYDPDDENMRDDVDDVGDDDDNGDHDDDDEAEECER